MAKSRAQRVRHLEEVQAQRHAAVPAGEPLEALYQRWWYPARLRPSVPYDWRAHLRPAPAPDCGAWYPLPAAIPATARWALIHMAYPPGHVLYLTCQAAVAFVLETMPLADHPHVRVTPVTPAVPGAVERWLTSQGLKERHA